MDAAALDVHAHVVPEACMLEKKLGLEREDRERILSGTAARLSGLA